MPHFVTQRSLYEVRERPSKTYSWKVFIASNIIVELPWNSLMAVLLFATYYWPIGMYRNAEAAGQFTERTGLMFLLIWSFLMFTSTFTDAVIAGIESAEAGGNIASLMFSLCLIFCGVLAGPNQMPGFWIFMYRVSPFTYLVDAMLSTGLANTEIVCSGKEILRVNAPSGQTCEDFLGAYETFARGNIMNPNATGECMYCPMKETNDMLAQLSSNYANRWRNFGLLQVYVVFNIFAAIGIYWLARVPKNTGKEEAPTEEALALERTRTGASAGIERKSTHMSRASRTLSFGKKPSKE